VTRPLPWVSQSSNSPTPPRRPVMLSVKEVAGQLRVSKMTVYRLIDGGELLGYRIGRSLRVKDTDLERYINGAVA
jgi:excisionase family DNA binding protein